MKWYDMYVYVCMYVCSLRHLELDRAGLTDHVWPSHIIRSHHCSVLNNTMILHTHGGWLAEPCVMWFGQQNVDNSNIGGKDGIWSSVFPLYILRIWCISLEICWPFSHARFIDMHAVFYVISELLSQGFSFLICIFLVYRLAMCADHLATLGLLMCMQCLCDLRTFITGPLLMVRACAYIMWYAT